jgi:hypothetical protein
MLGVLVYNCHLSNIFKESIYTFLIIYTVFSI